MSIRLRLTAWYSGILAAVLIFWAVVIYAFVYFNSYQEVEQQLKVKSERITEQIGVNPLSQSLDLDPFTESQLQEAQIYIQLVDYQSRSIKISGNMEKAGIDFPVVELKDIREQRGISKIYVHGTPFLVNQQPLSLQGTNEIRGLLQVGANVTSQERLLEALRNILIFGWLVAMALAITSGLILARKSMRPLVNVIDAANQIQSGNDLSVRIQYTGPKDEIGRLIETVNNMLERTELSFRGLEETNTAQRRFVSDASHELRTPLTTIRGNVDFLKKLWDQESTDRPNLDEETVKEMSLEAIEDMADEGKRMSRLISDMLSLARADTGQKIELNPIPLQILVQEVARRSQFLDRQSEWRQGDLSILNGIYVNGSKDYLQQMLFIFIENAFKYTPEGSVTLDAILYKGQVGLRISDTGIGMERDEVPFIFDRFYRADESRGATPGIGLGLSIAKWIIEEHHGSVEVVTKRGEGTTFIIWLPVVFAPPIE
ncbi:histidine kinase [Paenibacillus sp. Root52]|uniref:histidine kinase n=1 Tax=Paenibacillus amylolyticus TaxID=1451 RepID=A0AAP5LMF8_PAEAM|nr:MULTISPECIES: HAMP domain-containing sensor histidine kinase [Paenibacillus]KQY83910.1 histidine kinase [Paenibacillus sp. Root52]MCG7378930.1 HAMP domain-containing histidine kinase [Paenibacillus sp. ACRSA]MDR6722720.1 signal transduction histidine kinase [Paenibacillus amylolyticus]